MANCSADALGKEYIKSGLGQFVGGFLLGFVPILHYFHGAIAGDVGPVFLKNMTLWWGCPAVLMEYVLKTGGLGMVVVGICYVLAARGNAPLEISAGERWAPALCHYGLLFAVTWMAVGYVLLNQLYPNFYFAPVQTGKNLWLAGQLVGVTFYVAGICVATKAVRAVLSGADRRGEAAALTRCDGQL